MVEPSPPPPTHTRKHAQVQKHVIFFKICFMVFMLYGIVHENIILLLLSVYNLRSNIILLLLSVYNLRSWYKINRKLTKYPLICISVYSSLLDSKETQREALNIWYFLVHMLQFAC